MISDRRPGVVVRALLASLPLLVASPSPLSAGDGPTGTTLTKVGAIAGRVELVPGTPAAGCRVDVPSVGRFAITDERGAFELGNVPIGERTVSVFPPGPLESGRLAFRQTVQVRENEITYLGSVTLQPGWIYGHIEGADPHRLAAMIVHLEDVPLATLPNPEGYFVLDAVPPGERRVVLRGVWFPPGSQVQTITVKAGAMTRLNFRLQPPAGAAAPPSVVPPGDLEMMEGLSPATADPPPSTAQPDGDSRCTAYAAGAVRQVALQQAHGCGFSGTPWSADFQLHYQWCLRQRGTEPEREIDDRNRQLEECGVPATPIPLPGPVPR